MTITTATPTTSTLAQAFATRYKVVSIDFLWTSLTGFEDFTVYASTAEADVLTTNVPAFDYNGDACDADIRELLMTALDDTELVGDNTEEVGGTLFISANEDQAHFTGRVTASTPVSYSF